MAILGKFEEKQMTDKEYIEHEARERARAIRRGDAGHGYRCRAMFTTDDVGQWRSVSKRSPMKWASSTLKN